MLELPVAVVAIVVGVAAVVIADGDLVGSGLLDVVIVAVVLLLLVLAIAVVELPMTVH